MFIRQKSHKWRTHLTHHSTNTILTSDMLHVHHYHLNSTQHYSCVTMLHTSLNTLNHSLSLTFITRFITSQSIQNIHLTPFRTLSQSHSQLLQHGCSNLHHLTRRVILNLTKSSHSICHHSRILIRNHIMKRINETLFLHQTRTNIIQLANTHSSSLTYIRILFITSSYSNQLNQKYTYEEAPSNTHKYAPHECNPLYEQQEHESKDSDLKHPILSFSSSFHIHG